VTGDSTLVWYGNLWPFSELRLIKIRMLMIIGMVVIIIILFQCFALLWIFFKKITQFSKNFGKIMLVIKIYKKQQSFNFQHNHGSEY